MTFIEKHMKEHPTDDSYEIIYRSCPKHFGYEKGKDDYFCHDICEDCWNREVKEYVE